MGNINLIVITNTFPYGKGETFLEAEVEHWRRFNNVFVCSISNTDNLTRMQFPPNVKVINASNADITRCAFILCFLRCIFFAAFWEEFRIIIHKDNFFHSLKELISFSARAMFSAKKICNALENDISKDTKLIIYSYWMDKTAFCAIRVKKKLHIDNIKTIARGHGYDLYTNRRNGYIPYRNYLLSTLDRVYIISEDGCEYLAKNYRSFSDKFFISRLGSINRIQISEHIRKKEKFRVVSCSNCIPLKRIDKIIETLSLLSIMANDINISWDHFGDGPLYSDLKKRARNELNGKIECAFRGHISNADLLNYYKTSDYDLFINLSSSEGVPVSIMEAESFGIPIIATDVGGVKEIVSNGKNGYLLEADFSVKTAAKCIKTIINMSDEELFAMRNESRAIWENLYNADVNYVRFYSDLVEL